MSSTAAGWLQFALLVAALAACYVPLGNYIARIFTAKNHWRVERGIYKLMRDRPGSGHAVERLRALHARVLARQRAVPVPAPADPALPVPVGRDWRNVTPDTAWNTAASFTTNTNWQNYSGESTMSYLTQMGGLAVQNFLSAAVGLAVAIAMIRGFTRSRTDKLGNFWVDLTRGTIRLLLPLAVIGAIILMAGGRDRELRRLPHDHHAGRRAPDHRRRAGGLAGGHQGDGQQRRRLLQRQLGPSVREPEPVHQLVRELPDPADPVQPAAHVRQDGRQQPAGLRAARRHGDHLGGRGRRDQLLRDARTAGSRRSSRTAHPRARRCGSARRAARCSRRPPR